MEIAIILQSELSKIKTILDGKIKFNKLAHITIKYFFGFVELTCRCNKEIKTISQIILIKINLQKENLHLLLIRAKIKDIRVIRISKEKQII